MQIPYYPGCNLKTHSRNFENSAIAVANLLDLELVEMEKWYCCGTVFSLARDDLMHQLAPIRNLIRIQDKGEQRLVTLCDMCYNTLKRANLKVTNKPDELERINYFLDQEEDYQGGVEVLHFLHVLRDQIGYGAVKEKVTNSLKDLAVFPYYGCALLRPGEVAIDDPEEPQVLSELISLLGAVPIDDRYKIECCGSYHTVGQKKDLVIKRAHKILSSAVRKGADIVVLSCPLCEFNLDDRQEQIKEVYPDFQEIPVLGFTQLMGIVFGVSEEILGFDDHFVDPRPKLEKRKLLQR